MSLSHRGDVPHHSPLGLAAVGRRPARWDAWDSWDGPGRSLSKSVAKALRVGIGREKKRGISMFLFRRSGAIGAFAVMSQDMGDGSVSGHR